MVFSYKSLDQPRQANTEKRILTISIEVKQGINPISTDGLISWDINQTIVQRYMNSIVSIYIYVHLCISCYMYEPLTMVYFENNNKKIQGACVVRAYIYLKFTNVYFYLLTKNIYLCIPRYVYLCLLLDGYWYQHTSYFLLYIFYWVILNCLFYLQSEKVKIYAR